MNTFDLSRGVTMTKCIDTELLQRYHDELARDIRRREREMTCLQRELASTTNPHEIAEFIEEHDLRNRLAEAYVANRNDPMAFGVEAVKIFEDELAQGVEFHIDNLKIPDIEALSDQEEDD